MGGKPLRESRCRTAWVRYPEPSRNKILQPSSLLKPSPECFVCGSNTARIFLRGLADWKINAFAKTCLQGGLGAHRPALYLNGSCIFDPEWTLSEWDVSSGTLLQVEDEGQGFSCNIVVS